MTLHMTPSLHLQMDRARAIQSHVAPGQTEHVSLKQPVSNLTSILLRELVAILMTFKFPQLEISKSEFSAVNIFSDNQSAVGILTLGWEAKTYKQTVKEIKVQIKDFTDKGITLQIDWTPGHADILGNEIADTLAKEAAHKTVLRKLRTGYTLNEYAHKLLST